MGLEIIKQLNVDFHDAKYISINAKQCDKHSRFILVSCHNNGTIVSINKENNYAFIRYKKPDGLGVFNSCEIMNNGKILIELSEQMLAVAGKSYADLIIVNNDYENNTYIDTNTGELIIGSNSSILSTMHFCINVIENSFDGIEIESSYEYNALNDLLVKASADYSDIIKLSKSYANGNTGVRIDEDTDNSKYYYTQTKILVDSMGSSFLPKGTIKYSELKSVEKSVGWVYHISNAFVTDNSFKDGAGISYPAGTNVYYTSDGYWDCFSGQVISNDTFKILNETITKLENRIKALEEQTVLGITE